MQIISTRQDALSHDSKIFKKWCRLKFYLEDEVFCFELNPSHEMNFEHSTSNRRQEWTAYLAKDTGSHVYGTARLISSRKTKFEFFNSTLKRGIKYPTIASDFVAAASTCQEPLKLNMASKLPSGMLPDIPDFWLKYSAIWKLKYQCNTLRIWTSD